MRRPVLFGACVLLLLSGCAGLSGPSTPSAPPDVSGSNQSTDRAPVSALPNVSVSNQPPDRAPNGFPYVDSGPNGTFRTLTVGDPSTANFEGSLTIEVWNAGTERRELNVTLTFGRENTTLYRRAVQFPANETLRLRMKRAGRYALTVQSATGSGTLTLSRDEFDCNNRDYALRVNRTGTVDERQARTMVLCSPDG